MKLIVVPWLPSLKRGVKTWAITLAPYVLVIESQKDNVALLAHEQVHLDQIAAAGRLRWYLKYIFCGTFRREQENAGYMVQRLVEEKLKKEMRV